MNGFTECVLAVDAALEKAGLPHAFGGAIALAYCIPEPRGTRDVDVNIFVQASRADEALDAMPPGVRVTDANRVTAHRDGQVRLRWGETPIDLFFDTHEFHHETAEGVRRVSFEGATIPILGCDSLIVFKAIFNRPKDWLDIEEVLKGGVVDGTQALIRLRALLGNFDSVVVRLSALIEQESLI
jgi:hypothetical protein